MTKDEALRLALEYLEESDNYLGSLDHSEPIAAIKEALAQPEPKPVAWIVDVDMQNWQGQSEYRTILSWNSKPKWSCTHEINEVMKAVPLYTHPKEQL